ncbi:MAG: hypothetical protein AAGH65_05330 [Pseudomonadota bacterium]
MNHYACTVTSCLLAGLLMTPILGVADDRMERRLERSETISERGSEITMELMLKEYTAMGADAEQLRAVIPDGAWDDEYREAGQCMLDRYDDLIGTSGVDDMLDRMEALFDELDQASATMASMEALGDINMVEGVSTEAQMAIMGDCGLMEINMRRMQESGFMDVIQSGMMDSETPDGE